MRKKNKSTLAIHVLLITLIIYSSACDSKKSDQESLSGHFTSNKESVESQLIEAYNLLDGIGSSGYWGISTNTNWVLGSISTDNAYKGSTEGDFTEATLVERWEASPELDGLNEKWENMYEAIDKTNSVISKATSLSSLSKDSINLFTAEARFLRGFYHLELKKIFNNVPFVDDNPKTKKWSNENDIWSKIEADFQFAAEILPENQKKPARASSWAAKALLAKVQLFREQYQLASPILDDIIENGPFSLAGCFHDNFRNYSNDNQEFIFGIQMSEDGGMSQQSSNYVDSRDTSQSKGPGNCCLYHQPSQNLVNAYKTNEKGLPLLNSFNESDIKNDEGIESSEPFIPYKGTVDPRLDWTVGRRGIPYLDWGPHQGKRWIIDQEYAGPYSRKKNVFYKDEDESLATTSGWSTTSKGKNITYIRYAHILLWRAEVAVEEKDFNKARKLVNRVRRRATNGCYVEQEDGSAAANYLMSVYPEEGYPFDNQENARKAVRFESRLETAMEGHRFFNLRRWGVIDEVLNEFVEVESQKRVYLKGAKFEAKDTYMPIPKQQINNREKWQLRQNAGY